jgi:hypothetical protein
MQVPQAGYIDTYGVALKQTEQFQMEDENGPERRTGWT